jgi:DNA polymerase (family 10)
MAYFEELKGELPGSLAEITHVPGVGPKKAKLIYQELGVTSLAELRQALTDHKLRDLPGMGVKTEANIERGVALLERSQGQLLLNEAVPVAERFINYLGQAPEVLAAEIVGSLRRRQETVGQIELLCSTRKPAVVAERFCSLAEVREVVVCGDRQCIVLLDSGFQVDMRLVAPEEFGAALQYFTGSKAHNLRLQERAEKRGHKIDGSGAFAVEADVYQAIGLPWIDPALREDTGELEAALARELPSLISLEDIRGDLHVHTEASDGQSTLLEMVDYARALGYQYLAISDHAFQLRIAGGLTTAEFEAQWHQISKINGKLDGFQVLRAVELNIDSDGEVDFPAEFLDRYDLVTASIHSGFSQDRRQLTERMLAAIANPHVDVIAHPTGRILGRRDPYDLDLEAVFKAAAATGTALELNAFPDRLDLKDTHLREAHRLGCRFAINTDAHHSGQLTYMRYGVDTARRGWLAPEDVINTYPLDRLQRWLAGEHPA